MRLAGDCHDEQIRAMRVVGSIGYNDGGTFFVPLLIGEWERYEENFSKGISRVGSHRDDYSLSYSASASLSQTAAKLEVAACAAD